MLKINAYLIPIYFLFACSDAPQGLEGKWIVTEAMGNEATNEDNYYVFNSDGTANETNAFGSFDRRWKIEDGKLCIGNVDVEIATCGPYIQDGNSLTWTINALGNNIEMKMERK